MVITSIHAFRSDLLGSPCSLQYRRGGARWIGSPVVALRLASVEEDSIRLSDACETRAAFLGSVDFTAGDGVSSTGAPSARAYSQLIYHSSSQPRGESEAGPRMAGGLANPAFETKSLPRDLGLSRLLMATIVTMGLIL